MREIELVGVTHSVPIRSRYDLIVADVNPPVDFAEQLEVTRDRTVGIELFPGAHEVFADPPLIYPEFSYRDADNSSLLSGTNFFRKVASDLAPRGIEIVDMDDPRLAIVVLGGLARALDRLDIESQHKGGLDYSRSLKKERCKALINFINSSLRQDNLFNNIRDCDVDLVVIGMSHADILAADPTLQQKLGVVVANYLRVVPVGISTFVPRRDGQLDSVLMVPGMDEVKKDAKLHLVESELHRRKYNAFSVGRVLGKKAPKPDLLGRFYISGVAPDSLFELTFIDSDSYQFNGTIRDVNGDALVEGSINGSEISFTKVYDQTSCLPHKNTHPIYHYGRFDEATGQYIGRYSTNQNDVLTSGFMFTMRRFDQNAVTLLDKFNPGNSR